jgi:hypothetical protein
MFQNWRFRFETLVRQFIFRKNAVGKKSGKNPAESVVFEPSACILFRDSVGALCPFPSNAA